MIITLLFGLIVSSVYYDPIQAENGGEAIQLVNNGSVPFTLDSTLLNTKQSSYQLPSTTLLPGQGFLIGDVGWSAARDNVTWSLADVELPLSLANTDGIVELLYNDTVLDRLTWNTTNKVKEGKVLTHDGEAVPFFFNSNSTLSTIPVQLIIVDSAPEIMNVTMTDDSPTSGVQWLSYKRVIKITVTTIDRNNDTVFARVQFNGEEVNCTANVNTHTCNLVLDTLKPGTYSLKVVATDNKSETVFDETVTVLSTASIQVNGQLVLTGKPGEFVNGSVTITNEGNTAKQIALQSALEGLHCSKEQFTLEADESQEVFCSIHVPQQQPGTYNYTVRAIAS